MFPKVWKLSFGKLRSELDGTTHVHILINVADCTCRLEIDSERKTIILANGIIIIILIK